MSPKTKIEHGFRLPSFKEVKAVAQEWLEKLFPGKEIKITKPELERLTFHMGEYSKAIHDVIKDSKIKESEKEDDKREVVKLTVIASFIKNNLVPEFEQIMAKNNSLPIKSFIEVINKYRAQKYLFPWDRAFTPETNSMPKRPFLSSGDGETFLNLKAETNKEFLSFLNQVENSLQKIKTQKLTESPFKGFALLNEKDVDGIIKKIGDAVENAVSKESRYTSFYSMHTYKMLKGFVDNELAPKLKSGVEGENTTTKFEVYSLLKKYSAHSVSAEYTSSEEFKSNELEGRKLPNDQRPDDTDLEEVLTYKWKNFYKSLHKIVEAHQSESKKETAVMQRVR